MRAVVSSDARLKVATRAGMVPLREKAAMQRMVLRAIRTDRRAERSRGATPRGLMAQRMGLPSWFTHMDGGGR